ncbi:hypothetical protein EDB81DRAFT_840949 [Dactylonectria macrodidyma]|uniref:Cytokinesis inhibitor byr4 n=1 Tax=Dactylonectria macrodidyma TaxID=307937 RepID=A0A9P9J968_9HYPO|nr:hypothetical protein EDB81DRAFT_840949 [Dactylonectria macrodidyma]
MEPLRLKPRQPMEDVVENWDDDDFVVEGNDLSFRSPSTATNVTSRPPSRRRDSGSSHLSLLSELDGEEEKHVHIPGDDEKSTLDAIAAAQSAGIPLPRNVPTSALMGGTIKRLGGRKIRKIIQDDWENDLELPDASQGFKIKKQHTEFPESLRQVSGGSIQASPTKLIKSASLSQDNRRESNQSTSSTISALSAAINLDRFKDVDDDDDFFGDGGDTIKVSKSRQPPKPVSFITPPTPSKDIKIANAEDDFEMDLELPSDGKLKLSTRKDIPKTPSTHTDDLDWGEGSLGTRYGGTRRDGRSNRSSSASALSPSVSSSITAESEDETFEGLVLPTGPVNFSERLQQRRKSRSPHRISEEPLVPQPKPEAAEADKLDFLDGLDLGDGEVFDSGKLTLHRNVKVKETRPASPARPKAAVSLTFTNKPVINSTRIPRLNHHERTHSTSLEPVYESGGPAPRSRRPQSRLGGHSAQSSVTSLPTPTTPSPSQSLPPTTPRRRELGLRTSTSSLRTEPTTTSAQLLKQKRSLPAIRALNSPAKQVPFRHERPPSRSESNRPLSGMRPKTPIERQRPATTDSLATSRKPPLPFSSGGPSHSQSQHANSRTLRQFRRHDSDNSIDLRPHSRTISRSTMRSPSPHRFRVTSDTWERLSKPKNKKNFGDGHELDGFDDLPTSKESETKFLRQPTTGPKAALRNKLYQNLQPERASTTSPQTPQTPARPISYTPHFARDTKASRIARETSLAQRVPSNGPLAPLTTQRVAQLSVRNNLNTSVPQATVRSKKHKRSQQLKPHLIANLNSGKESKMVNGMYYNAETFRWEGNENALNLFDAAVSTPIQTPASNMIREKEAASTPRPALITNISATKGVQVVGGMVFDPQAMCWLKLDPPAKPKSDLSDPMDGFDALESDEDVFKDIPDLEDVNGADEDGVQGRVSDIKDDWLVGEEFDVGPEFIRRQREEEDRWRKKCERWVGRGTRDREAWRWTIRELVSQFDDLAV